jgi:hypothetical protein
MKITNNCENFKTEKIDIYTKIPNSKISNLIFVDLKPINIDRLFFDPINLDLIKKTSSLSFPHRQIDIYSPNYSAFPLAQIRELLRPIIGTSTFPRAYS